MPNAGKALRLRSYSVLLAEGEPGQGERQYGIPCKEPAADDVVVRRVQLEEKRSPGDGTEKVEPPDGRQKFTSSG